MDARALEASWESLIARARSELDWSWPDRHKKALPEEQARYLTYLDTETWLKRHWKGAVRLDLHRLPPQRILDLGTGSGHFSYVCRCLGHEVVGLERPGAGLEPFHEWLGLNVVYHAIEARKSLPRFEARFDTVTSWRVPFNKKRQTGDQGVYELFGLGEWAFLFDDIRDNVLRPGGRLALKMNALPNHVGLHYGDPELMAFFRARGALPETKEMHVIFDPLR